MIETVNEIELACSCCLELQDAELPLDLLPVAYDDASWLSKRTKADAHLLALVSVGSLSNEVRLAKATKAFLTLHGKWEKKVADALHRVMRRMQADVKRRIIDFQSLEPTRILPKGKWWRAARQAVLGPLTQAALESARQTLRDYNSRRLRKQDDLSWSDSGDVLIAIPPDAKAAMADGISETMGKDYWMAWEDTTRASVFQTITTGMDAHLSLLQIADTMDDAWAFDYKRAMLVARTECTGSLNSAHNAISHKLIDDPKSIVNGKEWLSIIDNDTRPAHRAANGQRVLKLSNGAWVVQDAAGNQIGTGDTFILGNERARYPGDPNLPAGFRVNCRCTQVSLFEGELGEEAAAAEEAATELVESVPDIPLPEVPIVTERPMPLLPVPKPLVQPKPPPQMIAPKPVPTISPAAERATVSPFQGILVEGDVAALPRTGTLGQVVVSAETRLSRLMQERVASTSNYKTWESKNLQDALARFSNQVQALKASIKTQAAEATEQRLVAVRAKIAEIREEITRRKDIYAVMAQAQSAAESTRRGKIALQEGDVARLLSAPGDVYIDAGWRPGKGPAPYSPELFITSDISGKPIRHYVKLPDGRICHPDELKQARSRGNVIIVGDVKVPNIDWTTWLVE
uniref:Putative capsid morphogenesis protein n=1 Tax=viral metagenome TaxID=1070528 RepID=A0A6M3L647_9ZZZZ